MRNNGAGIGQSQRTSLLAVRGPRVRAMEPRYISFITVFHSPAQAKRRAPAPAVDSDRWTPGAPGPRFGRSRCFHWMDAAAEDEPKDGLSWGACRNTLLIIVFKSTTGHPLCRHNRDKLNASLSRPFSLTPSHVRLQMGHAMQCVVLALAFLAHDPSAPPPLCPVSLALSPSVVPLCWVMPTPHDDGCHDALLLRCCCSRGSK